ncbi:uncharacterized protein V1518DRAFT_373597 [Limtongia smithiae]|uniref:uncharacterized protein n=1 Tax=Limtongia smithiae TaxID=1125753 RepID=UPI0034CFDE22
MRSLRSALLLGVAVAACFYGLYVALTLATTATDCPEPVVEKATAVKKPALASVSFTDYSAAATADKCENPYSKDGYLYFDDPADTRSAQFFPFDVLLAAADDNSDADPVIDGVHYFGGETVPRPRPETFKLAPHNWYNDLQHLQWERKNNKSPAFRALLEQRVAWMKDKTVLLIGDSTDRYLSLYFCENALGGHLKFALGGIHSTSSCVVPALNLTILTWHVASLYETKPKWWMNPTMTIVSWEERWSQFFMPSLVWGRDSRGQYFRHTRTRPDLIIVQSGLWDHNVFVAAKQAQDSLSARTAAEAKSIQMDHSRAFNYRELRYFALRMDKILGDIVAEFPDTPVLCRSLTQRANGSENAGMNQFGLALSYACRKRDIEMMPFGRIVRDMIGVPGAYADFIHFREGAISSLFHNMMLWYLNRAAGGVESQGQLVRNASGGPTTLANWNRCHNYHMLNYP